MSMTQENCTFSLSALKIRFYEVEPTGMICDITNSLEDDLGAIFSKHKCVHWKPQVFTSNTENGHYSDVGDIVYLQLDL